jgi:Holliday junction resolvasome RuvABC ATP-dependent DNA helicase subunit
MEKVVFELTFPDVTVWQNNFALAFHLSFNKFALVSATVRVGKFSVSME